MREHGDYDSSARPGNGAARSNGERSPVELQEDIQRHRHNLDRTLSALGNKLSPGELLDEGLRYMKHGPGEFFANLAQTAKHNPVPVALTGIGLAWLMLGQRESGAGHTAATATAPQHDDSIELYAVYLSQEYPFAKDEIDCIIYDDLGAEAYDSYQTRTAEGSGLRGKAAQAKGAVGTAMDHAGEKAAEWSEKARSGATGLSEEGRARINRARKRLAAASGEMRERAERARAAAWHRAQQAKSAATAQAHKAMHFTGDLAERYPLSLLAVGVAAGAALGTALPETRREDRLLGETSDALKAQASETFDAQAQRVRQAATAVRDAAVEEARAQGLTAEGLREEGSKLGERAAKVAGAAGDEAQRQGFTAEGAREELERTREKIEHVAAAARDAARDEGERHH
ncbi:MAG: DUF3618 domain-containing protein [Chromatocurvus sp.]